MTIATLALVGALCGQLEVARHNVDLPPSREWYTVAYVGDTLCWRAGQTVALGDSVALSLRIAFADGGGEYFLGRAYNVREPAKRFIRLPWGSRGDCIKMLAEFPAGTRPGPLRIVPVPQKPPSAPTRLAP